MQRVTTSSYKGFSITTRCRESAEPAKRGAHWFKASFAVDASDASEGSWQQFPDLMFATSEAATLNALRAAELSVDILGRRLEPLLRLYFSEGPNPGAKPDFLSRLEVTEVVDTMPSGLFAHPPGAAS
jgi:hypothetical protein